MTLSTGVAVLDTLLADPSLLDGERRRVARARDLLARRMPTTAEALLRRDEHTGQSVPATDTIAVALAAVSHADLGEC
jgi:hypothetical protein